jgi:hypothetical protein
MGFLIKRKELPTMKGLIVQLIYVKVQSLIQLLHFNFNIIYFQFQKNEYFFPH